MTNKLQTILLITGEPFLSRCEEWRSLYNQRFEKIWEYVESIGGVQFYCFRGSKGFGVEFSHREEFLNRRSNPKDWLAPNKRGISYPRKKTPTYEKVMSFEPLPSTYPLYEEFPLQVEYFNADRTRHGRRNLIRGYDPDISYFEINGKMSYFMTIPDYQAIMEKDREEHAQYHDGEELFFNPDVTNFKLPEGLKPLSQKMYNFLQALSNLQEDRPDFKIDFNLLWGI